MAKKRPSQVKGNVFTRSMEAKSKEKARQEYNDVTGRSFDGLQLRNVLTGKQSMIANAVQEVISNVKPFVPPEPKPQAEPKPSKDIEERRKMVAEYKARQPKVDESVSEALELLRLFGVMLKVAEQAKFLTKELVNTVSDHQWRARVAITKLKSGTSARMEMFAQYVAFTKRFDSVKLKFTQVGIAEEVENTNVEEHADTKIHQQDRDRINRLLELAGRKIPSKDKLDTRLNSIKRAMILASRYGLDHLGGGIRKLGNGVKDTVSGIGSGASDVGIRVAKSVAQVAHNLQGVSSSIKRASDRSINWVGDRLSSINRRLMGIFGRLKSAEGTSGITDWLAAGALASQLIPSLMEGFNSYMKQQYGEDWVTKLITEKWAETKATVMQWLDKFTEYAVDTIKNLPANAAKLVDNAKHAIGEYVNPTKLTNDNMRDDAARAVESGDKTAVRKFSDQITKYEAPGATEAVKAEAVTEMHRLLRVYPFLLNQSSIVRKLRALGINYNYKNIYGKDVSLLTNDDSKVSLKPGSAAMYMGKNASQTSITAPTGNAGRASPTSGPVVALAPSQAQTEQADAPKVAQAPSNPDSEGTGDTGSKSTPKTSGLSNATIPTQTASDTLILMNMHGLGY